MLGDTALARHKICNTDDKDDLVGMEPVSGIEVAGSNLMQPEAPSNDPRSSLFTSSVVKGEEEEPSMCDDAALDSKRGQIAKRNDGNAVFSFATHGGAINAAQYSQDDGRHADTAKEES